MKFITLFLLILFFVKDIIAQDTLVTCAKHPTYFGPDEKPTVKLSTYCPGVSSLTGIRAVLNGDTLKQYLPHYVYGPSGTQGVVNVFCNGIISAMPDTTFHYIGVYQPMMCFVTSDSNSNAVILVDSTTLYGNDTIFLERKVTTQLWEVIHIFQPKDPLIIVDQTSDTRTQSYTYRLRGNKNCQGWPHYTLHLQSNGNNLSWNQYSSAPQYRGYYIFKRPAGSINFNLIDSTSNISYTDVNFNNGDEYYVVVYNDYGCATNSWQKTTSAMEVHSNRITLGTTGISNPSNSIFKFQTVNRVLYVELDYPEHIKLFDITGRQLFQTRQLKFNITLEPGIYILTTRDNSHKIVVF